MEQAASLKQRERDCVCGAFTGDEPLILPNRLAAMVDAISTRVDCKILNAVGPIKL